MAWGKHFTSMYEGSMRGKGSPFFAVWGYVISHMIPNKGREMTVELNPDIIAFLIGEKPGVILGVVEEMCSADPKSRTKDKDGRKLVKLSEFTYEVVNGNYYHKIRNEEERREYQRVKQAEYRAKKLKGGHPDGGAAAVARAEGRFDIPSEQHPNLEEDGQ